MQGLSTYVRMMLSTQALLSAIGVGEKSPTVFGATFQWFLRDLTGMVGGVLFTCCQISRLILLTRRNNPVCKSSILQTRSNHLYRLGSPYERHTKE
ncbi:PREDICTED: protein root UVB sensitive 3-like [Nicotiana attenuata]|uniref:Protein root uvb sensitive 3 n=1 Tax=Nicotiana attenuata TaxID=49451 RepID=A0A1J6JXA7_NICAT|nr:PREDICTED: protein root UVB sensitive 3-like [Nicotiana attenuata]XP_019239356.1 PREDICTED: protein root UVB sensitive 3-like [Nicotiana attenuata]XP_019239357.1 PREDICTED: protein root UVB sensitive 3-like [Nicotiana attenuata]OIT21076.1 protein root uvb sensitive 3 [Nicotiana attenuata]